MSGTGLGYINSGTVQQDIILLRRSSQKLKGLLTFMAVGLVSQIILRASD
ncbi:hypothetical protein [Teredinibacter haidensis]|nr:hypothetical protein [Teredinibacter haidensis]